MRAGAKTHAPFDLYAGLMNRLDSRGLSVRQRFLTRLGGEAADAMDAFLDQARYLAQDEMFLIGARMFSAGIEPGQGAQQAGEIA